MSFAVDIQDIHDAQRRIQPSVGYTPLLRNQQLDKLCSAEVYIKAENLQHVGAFKFRGAYHCIVQMGEAAKQRGVVAWSSGNHAQGVAAAAQQLGVEATIVMPEDAPKIKVENTRRYGAKIHFYDRYRESRELIAQSICEQSGALLIPSYDHKDVIAGQGTVGLEIVKQLQAQQGPKAELDILLCPCGGGGLSAGLAVAVHDSWPALSFYGVEPELYDDTRQSLARGERMQVPLDRPSICDALQAPQPGSLTFPINQHYMKDALTVSDEEVKQAVYFAWRELKLVVEPGGAVALAALLAGRLEVKSKRCGIVLSGGNVDPQWFAELLQAQGKA